MTNETLPPALAGQVGRGVMQHTPGPWTCFYKSKYDEWHVSVPMSQGSMKWALFDDGVRSENPEADARLIAAAPDLLEALIAMEAEKADYMRSNKLGNPADEHTNKLARAAIAKALPALHNVRIEPTSRRKSGTT